MTSEAILIEEYIAKKGVRRFEAGSSASYGAIQHYLRERDYDMRQNKSMFTLKRLGKPGMGKRMTWAKVIAFVDEMRVSEGLEPLSVSSKQAA